MAKDTRTVTPLATPVETDWIDIDDQNWVNIVNGSPQLSLFLKHPMKIRVMLSSDGTSPAPDYAKYFMLSSGTEGFSGYRLSATFSDLKLGEDIFVMNDSGSDRITVVRGDVRITTTGT